tara:strand:+ start:281 stop:415 length:135 start_codon:yes stop_codon:yes gene_type:complete
MKKVFILTTIKITPVLKAKIKQYCLFYVLYVISKTNFIGRLEKE